MAYLKIRETAHGELGHNGWTWVLDHPVEAGEKAANGHPAYYEETGLLVKTGDQYHVEFCRTFGPSRSGLVRDTEIRVPLSADEADAGMANRAAYDAVHRPAGGYVVVTD
jgi:hypothetical protein